MAGLTLNNTSEKRSMKEGIDGWLLLAAILLTGIGLLAAYSYGLGLGSLSLFKKQASFVIIGIVPFLIFALVHPKTWRRFATPLYLINLLLLLLVRFAGKTVGGAERWIDIGPIGFQPSEFSKIVLVLTLSAFFANRREDIEKLSTFLLSIVHVGVPAALILMQPHLGATLVLVFTWIALCLVSGVPTKFLLIVGISFSLIVGLVLTVPPVQKLFLKPYQVKRVQGLLGPGTDTMGDKYQTDQSKIAIGIGGVLGVGFGNGERKAGQFIPIQNTDFVLSIIGEELGLVGCTLVLGLFALLFYRIWLGLVGDYEPFYQTICAGVLTVLAFHTIANVGMVLEILPVVGLYLPFISHGGTAIWLCASLVGLALNVRNRERSILFSAQS